MLINYNTSADDARLKADGLKSRRVRATSLLLSTVTCGLLDMPLGHLSLSHNHPILPGICALSLSKAFDSADEYLAAPLNSHICRYDQPASRTPNMRPLSKSSDWL